MTDAQRESYHKLSAHRSTCRSSLGAARSTPGRDHVGGRALGIAGSQRADPDFNTKVARPAYANSRDTPASSSTRLTTTFTPPADDTSRSPT